MVIYILTSEPYHDNSSIIGVFHGREIALTALKNSVDPKDINCNDYSLEEWDMEKNERTNDWAIVGEQVNGTPGKGWNPIRKDFKFRGNP